MMGRWRIEPQTLTSKVGCFTSGPFRQVKSLANVCVLILLCDVRWARSFETYFPLILTPNKPRVQTAVHAKIHSLGDARRSE